MALPSFKHIHPERIVRMASELLTAAPYQQSPHAQEAQKGNGRFRNGPGARHVFHIQLLAVGVINQLVLAQVLPGGGQFRRLVIEGGTSPASKFTWKLEKLNDRASPLVPKLIKSLRWMENSPPSRMSRKPFKLKWALDELLKLAWYATETSRPRWNVRGWRPTAGAPFL